MAIYFSIAGARTVIPGVYDQFLVNPSILAPAAPARDVMIFGEAEEGIPGSELDLRGNFFTDLNSVEDFYRSGPIVDAARMLFSNQPSPVFGGAVNRLYIYKTNASTRASKPVSSPANFGTIYSARYGERGNQIKTQIKTGQAESKPSKTFAYLPSPAARTFKVSVNGAVTGSLALAADETAADLATALNTVTGLDAAGGAARTSIASGPMTADLSSTGGDSLVITRASGAATFGTDIQAGDVAYIPDGSPLAGASDENAGAYFVVSATTTALTLRRAKSVSSTTEVNSVAFDLATGIAVDAAEILINGQITLSVDAATATGSGATLEVLENSADKLAAGMMVSSETVNILTNSTSSVADISATVPSAGKLKISLSTGSWASIPKAGDLIRIASNSAIAGATLKNAGLMIVESATSQSITCSHLFSGMTTEAVAATALNGTNDPLTYSPGFVSTAIAARRIDSSAERKVTMEASRSSDGASTPNDLIGGNIALEIGYYAPAATACTVSINSQRVMTITPTGSGLSTITVNTRKYATMQELVDYLNTQANVSAKIPDQRLRSLSPSALDMVTSVGCLAGQSLNAYNARLKKDYYDWKKFFDDNFSLISFQEGGMATKAGLPDAEAAASFLSGAEVGATSNADTQAALDEALKIEARMVIPLFSRDAFKDIDDALTDSGSSYTIDSINAALKAHVATASGSLQKKERHGASSYDGSFADALQKVAELSYERLQMTFQRVRATAADGSLKVFLPWMGQCAVVAGRVQAVLGTSMLRKPFLLNDVTHVGDLSLYTDTLTQEFSPDDRGQLEQAIAAGLIVFRAVPGFGVRMESPDLSTRSRDNDPQGWVWERTNVLFTCDETRQAVRSTVENFIGNRTSDTPTAVVKTAVEAVLAGFIQNGSIKSAQVTKITDLGNIYQVDYKITPTEALEAITLTATAERQPA